MGLSDSQIEFIKELINESINNNVTGKICELKSPSNEKVTLYLLNDESEIQSLLGDKVITIIRNESGFNVHSNIMYKRVRRTKFVNVIKDLDLLLIEISNFFNLIK